MYASFIKNEELVKFLHDYFSVGDVYESSIEVNTYNEQMNRHTVLNIDDRFMVMDGKIDTTQIYDYYFFRIKIWQFKTSHVAHLSIPNDSDTDRIRKRILHSYLKIT